jgi:hypothetical protein
MNATLSEVNEILIKIKQDCERSRACIMLAGKDLVKKQIAERSYSRQLDRLHTFELSFKERFIKEGN